MYIHEWLNLPRHQAQPEEMLISLESPNSIDNAEASSLSFLMLNGDFILWRLQGIMIKILGCPISSAQFCPDVLCHKPTKIEEDPHVFTDFRVHCCTTTSKLPPTVLTPEQSTFYELSE
jgi:hypothetical protein